MNSQNKIKSSLYQIPYFKNVPEEELSKLARMVKKRCFKKNELIFTANQKCRNLHILHTGKIKIFMVSENGQELIIHFLKPMNFFGEEMLFGENIYEANAQALSETVLFDINKKDLEDFIISHPRVGIAMLAGFGKRVKKLVKMVGDLALKDIQSRLVCWLVQMANEQGVKTNEGIEINGLSQEEVASSLGTVREPVSRCLNRLQEGNLIKLGRKKIIVPNIEYLHSLLNHIPSHIPTRHHS